MLLHGLCKRNKYLGRPFVRWGEAGKARLKVQGSA